MPRQIHTFLQRCDIANAGRARCPHRALSRLKQTDRIFVWCLALATLLLSFVPMPIRAAALRDLVMLPGARDNQLVGYGIDAGLAGDGDKDPLYTQTTIANMLRRYGITVPPVMVSAKNVA